MLEELFWGIWKNGQDGRECAPAYLFFKMHIKAIELIW
jgi:hypothetical protein